VGPKVTPQQSYIFLPSPRSHAKHVRSNNYSMKQEKTKINNTRARQHAKYTPHDSPWSWGRPPDKPRVGIGTRTSQMGHQAQKAFKSKPKHARTLSDQPQSPKCAMYHPQRQMETSQVPLSSVMIQSSRARDKTQAWQLEHPTSVGFDSPWSHWCTHSGTCREGETDKVSLPLAFEPRSRTRGKTRTQQFDKMTRTCQDPPKSQWYSISTTNRELEGQSSDLTMCWNREYKPWVGTDACIRYNCNRLEVIGMCLADRRALELLAWRFGCNEDHKALRPGNCPGAEAYMPDTKTQKCVPLDLPQSQRVLLDHEYYVHRAYKAPLSMARSADEVLSRGTPMQHRHSDPPESQEYHPTALRGCPWGHQAPGPCQESSYWCENLRSAQVPETPTQRGPCSQAILLGHPPQTKTLQVDGHQASFPWVDSTSWGKKPRGPCLSGLKPLYTNDEPILPLGDNPHRGNQSTGSQKALFPRVERQDRGENPQNISMTNHVLRTPGEPPGAMGRIVNAKTRGTGGHHAHVPRVEPNCWGQKTPRLAAPAIVLCTPSQQPGTQTHITDVKTRWTGGYQTLFPRVHFSHRGRKPHAHDPVFTHDATSKLRPSDLPQSRRYYMYCERTQQGAQPASSSSTFLHTWSIKSCDETHTWTA
jgi:hypothetical protein